MATRKNYGDKPKELSSFKKKCNLTKTNEYPIPSNFKLRPNLKYYFIQVK